MNDPALLDDLTTDDITALRLAWNRYRLNEEDPDRRKALRVIAGGLRLRGITYWAMCCTLGVRERTLRAAVK